MLPISYSGHEGLWTSGDILVLGNLDRLVLAFVVVGNSIMLEEDGRQNGGWAATTVAVVLALGGLPSAPKGRDEDDGTQNVDET